MNVVVEEEEGLRTSVRVWLGSGSEDSVTILTEILVEVDGDYDITIHVHRFHKLQC